MNYFYLVNTRTRSKRDIKRVGSVRGGRRGGGGGGDASELSVGV